MDESKAKRAGAIERGFEIILYRSRWIAAPIYLGLVAALLMLLMVFFRELLNKFPLVFVVDDRTTALVEQYSARDVVLGALSLIDIALVANLVLIVILAGYENFVSKLDIEDRDERLSWMGTIDFSGLKLKLFASMVAITGIELLKAFMHVTTPLHSPGVPNPLRLSSDEIQWLVIIHVTFLFTAVLAASTDWLASRAKANLAATAERPPEPEETRR